MLRITLDFLGDIGLVWCLALILALAAGVWAYHRVLAPLSPGLRVLLRALRLIALALLLLALLEPVLSVRRDGGGEAHLAILVDRSSSMRLPGTQGAARSEDARTALARLQRDLADDFWLEVSGFATDVAAAEGDSLYPWASQGATAIGDALEEILVRQGTATLGGILLLSDGAHTAGKDPALVARNLPLPVFTVLLGDTVAPPDLSIRQVKTHPLAYAGEPVGLRVVVDRHGFETAELQLRIRRLRLQGGQVERDPPLLERTAPPAPAAGAEEIACEITPLGAGVQLFEIEIATPLPEVVTTNNRRLVALEVREKKTHVLYIEGEPDWDFTFLKRLCDADTSLAYTYLVRQADGGFRSYGREAMEALPSAQTELAKYAGIMIGRLGPAELPTATLAALAEYVATGGGLLFLDALVSGPGIEGWHDAGWSRWLPVVIEPERRWGFTLSDCRATAVGLTHEVTSLADSPVAAATLWERLPPIWIREGHYATAPGALVLLTARTAHPPQEIPLLTLAPSGAARVAVLAGRGFWRWDFVMRSVSEGEAAAPEFWQRMVRWLSEPAQRERFAVRPVRRVFQDGEPPAFVGQLFDEGFAPQSGAHVRLRVERIAELPEQPPGTATPPVEMTLYPDGPSGRYGGTLAALPPGMYRYHAEALAGQGSARRSWRDTGEFWVEPMGAEFLQLASSPRTLELLARASGGYAATLQELDELIARIPTGYRRAQLVSHTELWNHWVLFAFIVGLLSIEWVVRRRKGLA